MAVEDATISAEHLKRIEALYKGNPVEIARQLNIIRRLTAPVQKVELRILEVPPAPARGN